MAADETLVTEGRPSEHEKIEAWRLEQLLRAGYSVEDAEALASRADVDLHIAVTMVARGCPPQQAARILL